MNIGKLNTYFQVYVKETSKDSVGQRSINYLRVTNLYGQHIIRNMGRNEAGNRENPVISEYVYCYYDQFLKPQQYLVDEFGQLFVVDAIRRTNDRSLLQLAVRNVSDREINVVEGVIIEEAITYIVENLQQTSRLPLEIDLNGQLTFSFQHNLDRYVHVTLVDPDGNVFDAEVDFPDRNTVIITSSTPLLGKAVVS